MSVSIEMGAGEGGSAVSLDLEELLATRLLVQGNSGSGKSHLLRRLLEGSAPHVQQIVIDPEGDFVTLADAFGHVAVEAGAHSIAEIAGIAARIREHRASVVLSLEGLEIDAQMKCAAAFLTALVEAPREHWSPALVVVDEAQLFAPAAAGEVSDEARRLSLGAMTNLMCRGRKRGLAGIIATQRLAKLAKNVAAEASNFLMGRTFLDIDMARAADLLGMERRQAEAIRDLARGEFLALGPALSRRPLKVRIGEVRTAARSSSPKLVPLPAPSQDLEQLLLTAPEPAAPPRPVPPTPAPTSEDLIRSIARAAAPADAPVLPEAERDAIVADALAAVAAESTGRSPASAYQEFLQRCRMQRLADPGLDLARFRWRLALARGGIDEGDSDWAPVLAVARGLPDDMVPLYLVVAAAARAGSACPSHEALAEVYGTSSPARVRRVLQHIEQAGHLVARTDLGGRRSLGLPGVGWTTAPADETPPLRRASRVNPLYAGTAGTRGRSPLQ